MNFLNVMLLGGGAAVMAPLLIHLWNRSRFRTVDWGAMHLLDAALKVNSRRVQWESLWLLLIRCMIPLLLAIALARPVLTQLQMAGAQSEQSLVLLLDESLSMQAERGDGQSNFEAAKDQLTQIAEQATSAELSLWTSGSRTSDLLQGTTYNTSRLVSALRNARGGAGGSDLSHSLTRGIQQLQSMLNPNRQLIFASDFQASAWRTLPAQDLTHIRQLLDNETAPTQLILLRVAESATHPNLAVELFNDQATAPRIGEAVRQVVRVHNHSPHQVNDVRVVFAVDGLELASRSLKLAAQATEQIEFACEFNQPGWHSTAVQIDDKLGIPGDDSAWNALWVTQRQRVLIIDPKGVAPGFVGNSRYLRLALAPFAERTSGDNRFEVQVVDGRQLDTQQLKDVQAVVVTAAEHLSSATATALEEFVRQGGGLMVFAGQAQDHQWYNDHWSVSGMLPMRFGQAIEAPDDQPQKLAKEILQAEPLAFLNADRDPLAELEIMRWTELMPADNRLTADASAPADSPPIDATATQPPQRLLNLANGHPLLVARDWGAGTVYQLAISSSDADSNLPVKAVYVPLMQSLTEWLTTGSYRSANVLSGQSVELRATPPGGIPAQAERSTPPQLTIIAPDQQRVQVPLVEGRAHFDDTSQPGLYRVATEELAGDYQVEPSLFSVSAEPSESQLTPLEQVELEQIAEQLNARLVDSAESYFSEETVRRDGQEIWRWFLAAVLGLLFLELLVGQRLTRGVV